MSQPSAAEVFEAHRAHLRGVAYRMLGSVADAEDILQEAFLRFAPQALAEIRNPAAYLSKLVSRLCLDQLKSARARRETYIGPWLPEPVLEPHSVQIDSSTELAQDISVALMLALERLSPLERAAFLLHDVFGLDYTEIAATLERSEDSCRQNAARARDHLRSRHPRYRPSQDELQRILSAFGEASLYGRTEALSHVLAEDAVFYSDGGGRVSAATKPVLGRERILRFLEGLTRKFPLLSHQRFAITEVNGLPGVIVHEQGSVVQTLAFEIQGGLLHAVYSTRNPDKLKALRWPLH